MNARNDCLPVKYLCAHCAAALLNYPMSGIWANYFFLSRLQILNICRPLQNRMCEQQVVRPEIESRGLNGSGRCGGYTTEWGEWVTHTHRVALAARKEVKVGRTCVKRHWCPSVICDHEEFFTESESFQTNGRWFAWTAAAFLLGL